jgi:hypothetical protein
LFQFAVTFLAKCQEPLISRPNASSGPSLRTCQLREQIPDQETVEHQMVWLISILK